MGRRQRARIGKARIPERAFTSFLISKCPFIYNRRRWHFAGSPHMSRSIIARIATSADGFIARRDGSVDCLNERPRPKGSYGMGEFYRSIDTILWGRKTYDVALEFQRQGVKGAAFDPNVKNYVFSRNPPAAPPPGVEFVSEDVKPFARRLRAVRGKDIWMMGGGELIASFLDAGEIDAFSIHIVPTLTVRHRGPRKLPSSSIRPAMFSCTCLTATAVSSPISLTVSVRSTASDALIGRPLPSRTTSRMRRPAEPADSSTTSCCQSAIAAASGRASTSGAAIG